jgi:hypothetical protein
MMFFLLPILLGISLALSTAATTAEKPAIASAPLLTPWAQQVDSSNPLPEYPCPLMERKGWLNLSGVWQLNSKSE